MEIENIIYNEHALVVQANELIRARKDDFTLLEAKLIRLVISQAAAIDTDLKTYSCRIPELAAFLDIPPENIYRDIYATTTGLMKKVIDIPLKNKPPRKNGKLHIHQIHWVNDCKYEDNLITIRLSDEIKPYIIGLDKLFTLYGIDSILGLPTPNSIKLFELLSSYESLANSVRPPADLFPHIPRERYELIFALDYLREYFNCIDKYPLPADFIKRVIDPSVKGINQKTAMRVSYRTAKEGRKVSYILFKINAWEDEEFRKSISSL